MSTETSQTPPRASVKSAQRTLELLELLAAADAHLSLSEIARRLSLPKSSLHELLGTMAQRGWVEVDPSRGPGYRLGVRALLVGTRYVDSDEIVQLVEPVLRALTEELGEASHLGRLDGADVVYLAKRDSQHPLRMYSAVGRRLPAHATAMGKAMLAERTWQEVDALLPPELARLTVRTITDRGALREELVRVRDQGFAVDDEESADGMRAVAIPLRLTVPAGNAISVSAPTIRLERAACAELAWRIQSRASALRPFPGRSATR